MDFRLRPLLARVAVGATLIGLVLASSGCADNVDAKNALKVTDVVTGWYDAGIVDGGKNKLVPSVSFRVQNTAGDRIRSVQFNAVFRVIGDPEELGSGFVRGIDASGLLPGEHTKAFVLRSTLGYKGEQPRVQILQHSQFRDAQVQIFAKHGSKQWVMLGEYKVDRVLLTQ